MGKWILTEDSNKIINLDNYDYIYIAYDLITDDCDCYDEYNIIARNQHEEVLLGGYHTISKTRDVLDLLTRNKVSKMPICTCERCKNEM